MADDVLDLFNQKSSRGGGIEGMESVVATVSGYHGTERFNLIKLISQTGASYVGAMSKSTTHLVCWRYEGNKYTLAKKFETLIVSHTWFEECVKFGKRVPEDPYLMKCGEEVRPLQFEGLLMQRENLLTRTQSRILADKTNKREDSEKTINDIRAANAQKITPSLSGFLEQDTSPVTSLRLRCPEWNKSKSKEKQSSGKVLRLSASVGDKGHRSSSPCRQHSNRRKRDIAHDTISKISSETSSKGRRLVKKNTTRIILESDISDSDEDCYVVGTSQQKLGDVYTSHNLDEGNEEQMGFPINLSPRKSNLPKDSANDVINCQESLHEDILYTNQSNRATRQPISSEPSCAICWTDFSLTRGILPCGHRYCYPCIQNWSDQLVSRGKVSTCPLCKEKFHCILKVDDAVASDQKVYSQSIPCAPVMKNVSILSDHGFSGSRTQFLTAQACAVCHGREPEEFLVLCQMCQIRCIHEYCVDPPLFPWVCMPCRDLRNVFQRG
ncbi:unnamed protein product [Rhodiola kirilowii]